MEIKIDIQYNQAIGKNKVLSSNAGVGSIITTKVGFFIMPLSISYWGFVEAVYKQLNNYPSQTNQDEIAMRAGVEIIDDIRFIEFLKENQNLINLKMLIDIPHLVLSDNNFPKIKEHPLFKRNIELNGNILENKHFTIPAIHFPRWFYSSSNKHSFKSIEEWKSIWVRERCNGGDLKYFAPPRDPYCKTKKQFIDNNQTKDLYNTLVQIPMLLICKNGHISDIPWYQLFCAGIDGKGKQLSDNSGFDLFGYDCCECEIGGKHELQWIENRNQSESWGVLKCSKCKKTYSLEGIMNIKPLCISETPWNGIGTKSETICRNRDMNGTRSTMRMVLATSNSVYYADSFSSLYIPPEYLSGIIIESHLLQVIELLNKKWYKKALEINSLLNKNEYWDSIDIIDKADNAGITITENEKFIIKNKFLSNTNLENDPREKYRFDEYKVFTENSCSFSESKKIKFSDIELPEFLHPFFKKIQQISSLALTKTQLGFCRLSFPSVKRIDGRVERDEMQKIYNQLDDEVIVLPANQTFGEGIFFEFNDNKINSWITKNKNLFDNRFNRPPGELGKTLKQEMDEFGAPKFYLLHTFSHIILKELEFSCGYPTASLQERLYYSDRMCGVLIYTTDGSEGSMGGLVWQGQPHLISKIINTALERTCDCTSDPLCWEAEEQLNLSACFSCSLVSETSCEQRNLGLDRRVLIDPDFGFFKDLL